MRLTIVLLSFCLAACVGSPPRLDEIARHDFGELSGSPPAPGIPIAAVEVRAAPWLDTPAQAYRLAYADDTRRHAYADSRWVAPPGALLERALQRRIAFAQPQPAGPGCRLAVALDELEQRFETPQSSQIVLEARATLLPLRGDTALAKRAFRVVTEASPDARGGVMATRSAVQDLADGLAQWLGGLSGEPPQAINICKGRQS